MKKIDRKRRIMLLILCASAVLVVAALLFYPKNLNEFFKSARHIVLPFLLGLFFAFLFDKPVSFLEELLSKFRFFKRKMTVRVLSALAFTLVLLGIAALLIVPAAGSLSKSLSLLIERLPYYIENAMSFLNSAISRLGLDITLTPQALIGGSSPDSLELARAAVISFSKDISAFFLSLVIAVYMVIFKTPLIRQCDRFCYALFDKKTYFFLVRVAMESNKVFSGYFSGKLLQCLLVAVCTFLPMWALGLPYAMLISIIMGICNLISMVGPIIGALPCALLLTLESPLSALWFIVITVAVQFVMGQLVGPKLLGDSTGISSFWVLVAVIAGGGIGGVSGMIVGIPAFAVIYVFIREWVNLRTLRKDSPRFESECERVYNSEKD